MISPSQACGALSTGPVGVSVFRNYQLPLVELAKQYLRYNQQYQLSVVLQGMVQIQL